MADQQQQKTTEAAVGDQKQQPPGETPARYSTEQIGEAVAFLKEIKARLEGAPAVRDELIDLLVGLGNGHGDRHAAASRAAGLLSGHPDVLDMFNAFLTGAAKPPVPPPESLAASRPRRRRQSVPAEAKPDVSVSAGAGDRALNDPRIREALAFLGKVEIAGKEAWENFVKLLGDVRKDANMDAGEIYRRASGVLGAPEHADLLHEFATRFLPGEEEWQAQQQETRRHAAAAKKTSRAATAVDGGGDRRQHAVRVGGSSGGGAQFETNVVTLEVVKKRCRADDGDHRQHDDNSYTPRVRIKKPRTDDAGFSGCRASAGTGADVDKKPRRRTANGGEGCSTAPVPPPPADTGADVDKKSRRRTANGGEGCSSAAAPPPASAPPPAEQNDPNALYRRFRELWVFYTHYSTMVETMARVEKLLDGDDDLPLTVEKMFPGRRHREFLETYYAGHWGKMKAKLEGGETAAPALEAVLESLQRKEEEAVAEEVSQRRRRDVARAVERLHGRVMDMVRRQEEERRRLDAGDGGASGRHVGHRR